MGKKRSLVFFLFTLMARHGWVSQPCAIAMCNRHVDGRDSSARTSYQFTGTVNYRSFSSIGRSENPSNKRKISSDIHQEDPSCINHAHSVYVKCAVNPDTPCGECPHYELA